VQKAGRTAPEIAAETEMIQETVQQLQRESFPPRARDAQPDRPQPGHEVALVVTVAVGLPPSSSMNSAIVPPPSSEGAKTTERFNVLYQLQ
jgi:hypothetical protein